MKTLSGHTDLKFRILSCTNMLIVKLKNSFQIEIWNNSQLPISQMKSCTSGTEFVFPTEQIITRVTIRFIIFIQYRYSHGCEKIWVPYS